MSPNPSNNQSNNHIQYREIIRTKIVSFFSTHWTLIKVSAVTGTVLGLISAGIGIGVWVAKVEQPAEIATLQSETKRLQELNIKVESEKNSLETEKSALEEKSNVLEIELKKQNEALEEALALESSITESEIDILSEEVSAISEPATTEIEEQDTSLFFEKLNVSIVDINSDTEPYTALLSASGNNSKPLKYSDLIVGDKVNYSLNGEIFEITVTTMSYRYVGISVTQYRESE